MFVFPLAALAEEVGDRDGNAAAAQAPLPGNAPQLTPPAHGMKPPPSFEEIFLLPFNEGIPPL